MKLYCASCGNEFNVQSEHPSHMPEHCNKCGSRVFSTDKPEKTLVPNSEKEERQASAAEAESQN